MFTQEGSFMAVVKEAILALPPDWRMKDAGPDDFDVCLRLERADNPAESDWWRGEFSQNYSRQKNKEHLKQCEITMENLHGVGFEGFDLSTVAEQLVGKTVPITTKLGKANADGKQYMNVYLGGGYGPVAMDKDEAARRVAAMFGNRAEAGASGGGGQQQAAGAGAAQATGPTSTTAEKPNPLVKCATCGKYGKALKSTGKCPGC
jgi:hypothetical protein